MMAAPFRRESALTNVVFALHWSAFYFSLETVRHLLAAWMWFTSLLAERFA